MSSQKSDFKYSPPICPLFLCCFPLQHFFNLIIAKNFILG